MISLRLIYPVIQAFSLLTEYPNIFTLMNRKDLLYGKAFIFQKTSNQQKSTVGRCFFMELYHFSDARIYPSGRRPDTDEQNDV